MKVKHKILSGFLIVIVMLIASGLLSIYEFVKLNNNVQSMLRDNYKSIEACNLMLDAIEIIDENMMIELIGEQTEYVLHNGDSLFNHALLITKNNLTELNEDKYIAKIENSYKVIRNLKIQGFVRSENSSAILYYHENVKPKLNSIIKEIEALLELNQDNMFRTASDIENQARRALMPGIIAIISALIFAFVFQFFINKYIVQPISDLTRDIRKFYNNRMPFNHDINTNDEIQDLYDSVEKLIIEVSSKE